MRCKSLPTAKKSFLRFFALNPSLTKGLMSPPTGLNLGFLTVLQETNGFVGGYLVTNGWGRPLEFRLSTAVQPNRVQQILYGGTLQAHVCSEVIGKALVDKSSTAVQLILTDREAVLELRASVKTPVTWLPPPEDRNSERAKGRNGDSGSTVPAVSVSPITGSAPWICHRWFPEDQQTIEKLLARIQGHLDLAEPFVRVREAIAEARRMGVTARN
jgi:hypothetical protein